MATLQRVDIHNVRNLEHVTLEADANINLICGANASGKTSFLEAIHVLTTGRSFRTHRLSKILSYGQSTFTISGQLGNTNRHQIGVELKDGRIRLRANGQVLKRTSELATLLTCIPVHQESYQILTHGPRYRRQFLDWAVFHVEQSYLPVWKRCQRALKQRNSALQLNPDTAGVWDQELTAASSQLYDLRNNYFNELKQSLIAYCDELLPGIGLDAEFFPGWDLENGLAATLKRNLPSDIQAGYSRAGPHRADLRLTVDKRPIQDVVSRGQLKLAITAMMIAQAQVYRQRSGNNCILLIDDLDAELDDSKVGTLSSLVASLGIQVFISTTSTHRLPFFLPENKRMFHVKHGIIEMI